MAVCFAPPVHTVHPGLHSQTSRELYCEALRQNHQQLHYKQWWDFTTGGNQQCFSMSAKPKTWLLILEIGRQRHTPLSTSVELGCSTWTVKGSLELQSLLAYLSHYTSPLLYLQWKHRRAKFWARYWSTFTEGQYKAFLLETSQTGMAHAWPRTVIVTSTHGTIYRASLTSGRWHAQWLKDSKRQHPPQPQSVHPATSWKRYRSIHCHATRLWSSFSPQAERLINSSSTLPFPK